MTPSKPSIERYPEAFELSQCFLNWYEIDSFPVNINDFISKIQAVYQENILVFSSTDFEKFHKQYKFSKSKKSFMKPKEGKIFYEPRVDSYCIVYNPYKLANRIRFTIIHELAHLLLGHLDEEVTELNRDEIPDKLYFQMEGEANTFAGNFLAPPILIDENCRDVKYPVEKIMKLFKLSKRAVKEYRYPDYLYWKTLVHSQDELDILERYICKKSQKYCIQCGTAILQNGVDYCYICGNNKFAPRGVLSKIMIYPKMEVNEFGKVKICPICENEEIFDGDYCQICGTELINRCSCFVYGEDDKYTSNCCKELPLNARYCPYCGGKSTFFINEILKPWKEKQQNQFLNEDDDYDLPW